MLIREATEFDLDDSLSVNRAAFSGEHRAWGARLDHAVDNRR